MFSSFPPVNSSSLHSSLSFKIQDEIIRWKTKTIIIRNSLEIKSQTFTYSTNSNFNFVEYFVICSTATIWFWWFRGNLWVSSNLNSAWISDEWGFKPTTRWFALVFYLAEMTWTVQVKRKRFLGLQNGEQSRHFRRLSSWLDKVLHVERAR